MNGGERGKGMVFSNDLPLYLGTPQLSLTFQFLSLSLSLPSREKEYILHMHTETNKSAERKRIKGRDMHDREE